MTDTATDPAAETTPAPTADLIPAAAAEPGWRVVARTIIRGDQDLDIRPLYINGLSSFGGAASDARQSGSADDVDVESNVRGKGAAKNQYDDTVGEAVESVSGFGSITDDGATAEPERRLTFGSYFNAFPASYWRRWTDIRTVRLTATVSGSGTLLVYRSTAKGHVQRADAVTVDKVDHDTLVVDLSLQNFIDGGWYWFDIEAGDEPFTVHNAHWSVETERAKPGTVSIGITTFNRPDFCVDQLVKLAQQPAVLEILDEVIVVDQGNQKVRDHALFEQASKALGKKLRYIEQGNLGGSGGFSRSMDEATVKGSADYVLLLDDDVVCEPEGILRAVTFADLTKQPMLVGGQMFSLYDRTVMHAYGETVARWRWFWGPAPKTKHGHNFAQRSLRSTKWLHRRVDVDYNGWWMCLIPTEVIRQIGLSLPMFIKWDDAEFGLRAADAGFKTATLPGVAVWHVPWHEKDDTIDWQAYFHRRNRIIAALLHTPYERGGRLIQESFETQVKHVLSMQYAPAEMGLMAIEDILEGPERMHRDLRMRLGELNALRKRYDDSIAKADLDQFPTPRRKKPPRRGRGPGTPVGLLARAKTMALSGVRQALPVRDLSKSHPEANIPHVDLKWWLLAQFDSALVSSADGTSAAWYKRDPKQARDLMARSISLHVRLAKEWPELAQTYKDALPELASPKTWAATFEDSLDGRSR